MYTIYFDSVHPVTLSCTPPSPTDSLFFHNDLPSSLLFGIHLTNTYQGMSVLYVHNSGSWAYSLKQINRNHGFMFPWACFLGGQRLQRKRCQASPAPALCSHPYVWSLLLLPRLVYISFLGTPSYWKGLSFWLICKYPGWLQIGCRQLAPFLVML